MALEPSHCTAVPSDSSMHFEPVKQIASKKEKCSHWTPTLFSLPLYSSPPKGPSLIRPTDRSAPFMITPTVACGTFGKIRIGYDPLIKSVFAVKEHRINHPWFTKKTQVSNPDDVQREVEISRRFSDIGAKKIFTLEHGSKKSMLVLSKLFPGDLRTILHKLHKQARLKDTNTLRILGRVTLLDVATTLNAMHLSGFAHRDVKLENIFLAEKGGMVLGDFGCAIDDFYDPPLAGTLTHLSPEMLDIMVRGKTALGCTNCQAADVWALGISVCMAAMLKHPFHASDPSKDAKDYLYWRQSILDPQGSVNETALLTPKPDRHHLFWRAFYVRDPILCRFMLESVLVPACQRMPMQDVLAFARQHITEADRQIWKDACEPVFLSFRREKEKHRQKLDEAYHHKGIPGIATVHQRCAY